MTTSCSIGTPGCRSAARDKVSLYEFCRCAPSDFACPRASRVQPKQDSDSSRRARDTAATMLHHCDTGLSASRRISNINCWLNHNAQSKLCYTQLSKNGWLNDVRSCVSIQQNCQELRRNFGESCCAVDRLSRKIETHKCGAQIQMRSCWHIVKYFHSILLLCTWGLNIHGYFR